MGTGGIYFYKLVSEYPNDVTKACKLTINEIDSNFKVLKDADIDTAEYDEATRILVLTRNNGEKLIVDLGNVTYNLNVEKIEDENGVTLNISYNDKDGDHFVSLEHVITKERLMEFVEDNVLTRVFTDYTLRGDGTIGHPLGLNGVEKTGSYAPAKSVVDLTNGDKLPTVAKEGTRYVTIENVHDYGVLYNKKGLMKIADRITKEGNGWRVPTKADWDALLNSMEPCEYQNHNSTKCHVELGMVAGKYLKSDCGWEGQVDCDCSGNRPVTASTDYDICTDDGITCIPEDHSFGPCGVDKYGMAIRPSGEGSFDNLGNEVYKGFGNEADMWTSSYVCDDEDQDLYVKSFIYDKSGVVQEAQCPDNFYSVRLVKDFDGDNYFSTEYVDGVAYNTVLFPNSKQVWLASNVASTEGYISIDDIRDGDYGLVCSSGMSIDDVEYMIPNNGEEIQTRKAIFINEWNGEYWDKKMMPVGATIVVEDSSCINPSGTSGNVKTVCWKDEEDVEHCVDVEIPVLEQSNLEYRVYADDECNQMLVNTDDIVTERVITVLLPILDKERTERIKADEEINDRIDEIIAESESAVTELWDAINEEASARTEVDNQLWEAINEEFSARTDVDNQLWNAINEEASARTDVDNQLWEAIADEASARTDVDNQLWTAINDESVARQEVDNQQWDAIAEEALTRERIDNEQWDAINGEIARAKEEEARIEGLTIDPEENPYELKFGVEEGENLILKSKDGNEENFIRIIVDGNFGEI